MLRIDNSVQYFIAVRILLQKDMVSWVCIRFGEQQSLRCFLLPQKNVKLGLFLLYQEFTKQVCCYVRL